MSQLKFRLKIWNNIFIRVGGEGWVPWAHPLAPPKNVMQIRPVMLWFCPIMPKLCR